MNEVLIWIIEPLNDSTLNTLVTGNQFVFPILEMAHFMGLCLLFGALLIIDLRIVGFAPSVPIQKVDLFVKFALLGFATNFLTGFLFIVADSDRYLVNSAFWIKMTVIAFAGLNSVYFFRKIKPQLDAGVASASLSAGSHLVAWLSLATWSCVIILGRFIPFMEDL